MKTCWIVIVTSCEKLLTFEEKYRVFSEDKKEDAIEWAKSCGYDNFMPLRDEIGVISYCRYGAVEIAIMLTNIK